MDSDSCDCLSSVSGLFDWMPPSYPEDLAIYNAEGRCCLAGISHEGLAYIEPILLGLDLLEGDSEDVVKTGRMLEMGSLSADDVMGKTMPAARYVTV